ncbi:MAG: hypothetical protein WA373_04285 [Burkholderiales bacterium]
MNKHGKGAGNAPARPITTRRDYEGASVAVKQLTGQTRRDAAAELRLQALLRETEKFDDGDDAASADPRDYDYLGPRRRWSDDPPDAD